MATNKELLERIAALETSMAARIVELNGARQAFKELRALINAAPVKQEPTRTGKPSPWQIALHQVQDAHGHVRGTFEKYDEVRAQMAANREAATT